MAKNISLQQFLMRTGKFRTSFDAEQAIRQERVNVSKEKIRNPKHFINPKTALVFCDGERLIPIKRLYVLMNKPKDVICQKSRGERSIYDFLEHLPLTTEQKASLFAVGRLDKDTEGLLIITNDGDLSNTLMDPDSGITKTYDVVSDNPLKPADIHKLETGVVIEMDDGPYRTQAAIVQKTGDRTALITITEGKKNQIKLMLKSVGNNVVHLKRISIGKLTLGRLAVGDMMQTTKEEILSLCLPNDDKD